MHNLENESSHKWLINAIGITIVIIIITLLYIAAGRIYYSHAGTILFGAPVLDVPIRIGMANEKVISTLVVPRREFYDFSLVLYTNNDTPAERARIQRIAGDGVQDRFGNNKNNGMPIPVMIYIYKLSGNDKRLITSFKADHETSEMSGLNQVSKIFYSTDMERGKYEIDVQILEDNSDISDTTAHLFVAVPGNLR